LFASGQAQWPATYAGFETKQKAGEAMSIRNHIEKNPFVYLIGVVVATAGISVSVDQYFLQKSIGLLKARHNLEIETLHTRLASIDRRVSGGDYLDIKSVAITKAEPGKVSPTSEFNSELGAYVTKDNDFWIYRKMKKLDLELELIDVGPESEQVRESMRESDKYINSPLLHVWSGKDRFFIKPKGLEKTPASLVFFPFVAVLKMSINDYIRKYEILGPTTTPPNNDAIQEEQGAVSVERLDKYYRGDLAGILFVNSWQELQSSNDMLGKGYFKDRLRVDLLTAQKIDNVFYGQAMMTFNDVLVNSRPLSHYYIRFELLFFFTSDHIFSIWNVIPCDSPLPQGEYPSKVTQWFSDLAILVD